MIQILYPKVYNNFKLCNSNEHKSESIYLVDLYSPTRSATESHVVLRSTIPTGLQALMAAETQKDWPSGDQLTRLKMVVSGLSRSGPSNSFMLLEEETTFNIYFVAYANSY